MTHRTSDAAPTAAPVSRLRATLVAGLLVFAVVTLFTNVIPAREDLRATRRMLDEQLRENEASARRAEELEAYAEALSGDRWTVRRAIREELNRTDEREVLVR